MQWLSEIILSHPHHNSVHIVVFLDKKMARDITSRATVSINQLDF